MVADDPCKTNDNVVPFPTGHAHQDVLEALLERAARHGAELALARMTFDNCTAQGNVLPFDAATERAADMASKYRDRVLVGRESDGSPIYQWVSGDSKQAFYTGVANALNGQPWEALPPEKPVCPLFDGYATRWFEVFKEPTLGEKARYVYRSRLYKHVLPAFAGKRLDEIKAADIQLFMNRLADEGKAKSTVRDMLNIIRQVFKRALDDELIIKDPSFSSSIKNPSKKVEKRKPLTEEQWKDVVENIDKLDNKNDRRFMAFLSYTPLRPGEVYGLRWEDIDRKNKTIDISRAVSFATNQAIVKCPKTEAGVRTVPLFGALEALLEPFNDIGYVIAREGGEPYTQQAHKRAWERIKRTIKVYGMTPYNWRHTYATAMIGEGIDPDTAKTIMGHTDIRMTMHYTHTQPRQIARAREIMNGRFARLEGVCDPEAT